MFIDQGTQSGFVWKNGAITVISKGSPPTTTVLTGIATGRKFTGFVVPSLDEWEPHEVSGFVLERDQRYELPQYVTPMDINSSGTIVGMIFVPELGFGKPFVWTNGKSSAANASAESERR